MEFEEATRVARTLGVVVAVNCVAVSIACVRSRHAGEAPKQTQSRIRTNIVAAYIQEASAVAEPLLALSAVAKQRAK